MPEQSKPSYQELETALRANQVATDVARKQRDAHANQVGEMAAQLDQLGTSLQAVAQENAALKHQVADLTAQLASRAEQRAAKKRK
jgi:hypothetical protein